MMHATSKRRGPGEDSIYYDASKNRYVGAVSLGFSPSGTHIGKKVTGRTKAEVRDKLRDMHKQVESGLRPERRYTLGDALETWLAVGVDGLSARTVALKPRAGYLAPPTSTRPPASKMGSSTSFSAAWTTLSAMRGMPSLRTFPDPPGLGILRSRTGSGRNEPSLMAARRSSRKPGTPTISST
jgi:hypothetical protein